MNPIIEKLSELKVVPVLVMEHVKDAEPVARALYEGGLPVAEVTFRTTHAGEIIKEMRRTCPEVLVGAGTILTCKQVDEAIEAGAQFIVSPGLNPEVVKYAMEKDILIIPGCVTPTEIEAAISMGLEVVKFFPAEPSGGAPMLKALTAPYSGIKFMPTGGINPDNLGDYLKLDQVIACGGSWIVTNSILETEDYDKIIHSIQEVKEEIRRWN